MPLIVPPTRTSPVVIVVAALAAVAVAGRGGARDGDSRPGSAPRAAWPTLETAVLAR
jgi:hypothetical protein